jgi:Uma2 family endonuclease
MGDTGSFTTRGAEGLDRRGFTLADVEKMIEAGILDRDEKFELIDGEIVPKMSPQATAHMLMKGRIGRWLGALAAPSLDVIQDATLILADQTFLDPDVLVMKADRAKRYPTVDQAVLVVEVADTSRARDLYAKAPRYGAASVPELWVAELNQRATYQFRGPGSAAWATPPRIAFDDPIDAAFLTGQSVRLAGFEA